MFYRNVTKNTFNPALNWNNYVPPEISGLQLWLDASQLGLANNDPIASWTDLSGNGNHATQGTAGYMPLFKTNIQNSLPGVLFDGSDDFLTIAHKASLNCYPITIFSVVIPVTVGANTRVLLSKWDAAYSGYSLYLNKWVTETKKICSIYGKNSTNYTLIEEAGSAFTNGSAYIVKYVVNSSTGAVSVNNGEVTSSAWTGTPQATASTGAMLLGKTPWSTVYTNYYFLEGLIYNKELSTAENIAINSYLSQKWGIAIA